MKGRKRHLLVDTEGLALTACVHPATIMDRNGVKGLLPHDRLDDIRTRFPHLCHVWLDSAYNGQEHRHEL